MKKFPIEIKEFDLCKIDGRIYEIVKVPDEMAEDVPEFYNFKGMSAFEWLNCDDCFYNYVHVVKDYYKDISSIYRLIGKDYVCIFERR